MGGDTFAGAEIVFVSLSVLSPEQPNRVTIKSTDRIRTVIIFVPIVVPG